MIFDSLLITNLVKNEKVEVEDHKKVFVFIVVLSSVAALTMFV